MNLLIAKNVTNIDVNEDYTEKFVTLVESEFETEIGFFDAGVEPKIVNHEKVNHIRVPPENRSNLSLQMVEFAKHKGFTAILYFPGNAEPKKGIVDKLFSPMNDQNIGGTYCDYHENDILMIQSQPYVVCRRIEEHNGNLLDLKECNSIVQYIPLDLYYVNS